MDFQKPILSQHGNSPQQGNIPVLPASTLFSGLKEIIISHEGQHYRLRITSRNKLILQK